MKIFILTLTLLLAIPALAQTPDPGSFGSVVRKPTTCTDGQVVKWSDSTSGYVCGSASASSTAWTDVTGKPATFPPSTHAHDWISITSKPSVFTPDVHTHVVTNITDFPSTWAWASISGKPTTFTPTGHAHLWADISNPPATYAPSAHTHAESEVTNLTTDLAARATKVASGTATFTTTAVASLACQTTVTAAAGGTLTTDKITWNYATAPVAATDMRLTMNIWVTAGNVNFARCNNTSASVTPTAIVVNWMVTR